MRKARIRAAAHGGAIIPPRWRDSQAASALISLRHAIPFDRALDPAVMQRRMFTGEVDAAFGRLRLPWVGSKPLAMVCRGSRSRIIGAGPVI
ncbi:MAG: hypothetical protein ABI624_19745 [Casimicrobiaceae bacterium]